MDLNIFVKRTGKVACALKLFRCQVQCVYRETPLNWARWEIPLNSWAFSVGRQWRVGLTPGRQPAEPSVTEVSVADISHFYGARYLAPRIGGRVDRSGPQAWATRDLYGRECTL